MLAGLLTSEQQALLAEARGVIADLRGLLARLDAPQEDQHALEASLRQLDAPFLLVVVGEYNAGKSAFINALVGRPLLAEGITPTTSRIQVLASESPPGREEPDVDVVKAPVDLLGGVHVVDTPGTNAIERHHEALTRRFLPRADLVLFVTSADRPFTESERAFLEAIREWGKKVVFVLNKIDILRDDAEVAEAVEFVEGSALRLLGEKPAVLPVSARKALRAKTASDGDAAAVLAESRFESLEAFIRGSLENRERLRLKLLNPVGVGTRLAAAHLAAAEAALERLGEDVRAMDDVEAQLRLYREDLGREFRFRLADVENVLLELETRGTAFFDRTVRLGRVFDLLDKDKLRASFERDVTAETERLVEARVSEIIDWLVMSDLRQWQAVSDHIEARRERHRDRIVGRVGRALEDHRARLLDTVGRAARTTVESYDRAAESRRMAESVQAAVAQAAVLGASAVGLGTVVTLLATSAAADVTGILAAGVLAGLGLFLIPARREKAKAELRARIASLRQQLLSSLTTQFEGEVERSVHRIAEAVGPYTRFVRAERGRLDEVREALVAVQGALSGLRARAEAQ